MKEERKQLQKLEGNRKKSKIRIGNMALNYERYYVEIKYNTE